MFKKLLTITLFTLLFIPSLASAKDFKFVYFGTGGQMEMATEEKIVVEGNQVTVFRHAKQLGEGPEKRKTTQNYPVSKQQMEKIIEIVKTSGFMTWPKNPEVPHQSHADEYIEITLDGKTVRHNKWEKGHEESFRILYTHFNSWFTDVRSVRF